MFLLSFTGRNLIPYKFQKYQTFSFLVNKLTLDFYILTCSLIRCFCLKEEKKSDRLLLLLPPLLTLHSSSTRHPPTESSLHPSVIHNRLSLLPLTSSPPSSLQERSDHSSPSPTSSSTFYYPLDQELHYPQSSSSATSAGPQPHAGHAPPGQLPGSASVEAERRPVRDDAPPFGALPPVAAGDGAVFKVTEEIESPWKRRSEIARLGFVDGDGGEQLNSRPTENSDLHMTLI